MFYLKPELKTNKQTRAAGEKLAALVVCKRAHAVTYIKIRK